MENTLRCRKKKRKEIPLALEYCVKINKYASQVDQAIITGEIWQTERKKCSDNTNKCK